MDNADNESRQYSIDGSGLNQRIKKLLNDIIDVAYKDEPLPCRKEFKRFTINILPKDLKSSGGKYYVEKRLIELYNPRLGGKFIAKCSLHELAHHIDNCKNGSTGHQPPFYEEYARLIYAALDMRILTPEDFKADQWSRDKNKVQRIIKLWRPQYVDYAMNDRVIVKVSDCFDSKELLKLRGYRWNKMAYTWDREIPAEDQESETAFLEQNGLTSYQVSSPDLIIDVLTTIKVFGDTYELRESLRHHGFLYDRKTKHWFRRVRPEQKRGILRELKNVPEFEALVFR